MAYFASQNNKLEFFSLRVYGHFHRQAGAFVLVCMFVSYILSWGGYFRALALQPCLFPPELEIILVIHSHTQTHTNNHRQLWLGPRWKLFYFWALLLINQTSVSFLFFFLTPLGPDQRNQPKVYWKLLPSRAALGAWPRRGQVRYLHNLPGLGEFKIRINSVLLPLSDDKIPLELCA